MTELFEQLSYEHEARLLLQVFAEDVAMDVASGLEAERLMRHIVFLGNQIHDLLQMLRLYEQGYLFHQFLQWWGGYDIVVGDFRVLDLEPEDRS